MQRRTRIIIGAAALAGVAALGTGVALAGSGDAAGARTITRHARPNAEAAAHRPAGGGRVTGTEVGDEESVYEVEVTRADGSQVDVQLDEGFNVVADKVDGDTPQDNS